MEIAKDGTNVQIEYRERILSTKTTAIYTEYHMWGWKIRSWLDQKVIKIRKFKIEFNFRYFNLYQSQVK